MSDFKRHNDRMGLYNFVKEIVLFRSKPPYMTISLAMIPYWFYPREAEWRMRQ